MRRAGMVMPLRLGHLLLSLYRTAVEVHQATIRRGMQKDHAATTPVAGRVWLGARPRITHAMLLRQGQQHAALQGRLTTAPR